MLVMTFIALAAILRASGVDDPCCDRTAAIIMQCSLVRQTCPDDGMVTLDAANAQRLTDAYIVGGEKSPRDKAHDNRNRP